MQTHWTWFDIELSYIYHLYAPIQALMVFLKLRTSSIVLTNILILAYIRVMNKLCYKYKELFL